MLVLCCLVGTANARPRTHRKLHVAISTIGGALYVTSEAFVKKDLAPTECRWCDPPALDRAIRNAAVWKHTNDANLASNATGFLLAPVSTFTLVMLASHGAPQRGFRILDDSLPVIESAIFASLVNQGTKFVVGRERPFVHFAEPGRTAETDDNVSFFSGHTTLGFSLAVSAGMVAHQRGYKLEPVIWATGITLATTTAYLRIGADKHYFSDVLTGAVTGTAVGIAVPLLFHSETLGDNMMIAATPNSLSIAGNF